MGADYPWFIVSHPAVTCKDPRHHAAEHVRRTRAAHGRLPDVAMRARMAAHVEKLDVRMADLLAVDFLAFSPRTYYRLFEANAAVWPLQVLAPRSAW